jgi:tetratricopeptide (TPR) repeat protein
VDGLTQSNDVAGAIQVLDGALADKSYREHRPRLFQGLLNAMLAASRFEEARQRYLAVAGKDADLERAGFGVITEHFRGSGETTALVEWTAKLMDAPLAADLKQQAFGAHIDALQRQGKLDRIAALAPESIDRFGPAVGRTILEGAESALLAGKQFAQAGGLLDGVARRAEGDAGLSSMVARGKAMHLFLQERWNDAEVQFASGCAAMDDGDLRKCLATATGGAKNQWEMVERLCAAVLGQPAEKKLSRQDAAQWWVKAARERKDYKAVVERMQSLPERGIANSFVAGLCRDNFYAVLDANDTNTLKTLTALGERLAASLDADEQSQFRTMSFDAYFVTGDYTQALRLLDKGLPGRDEKWVAMSANKLRAHMALKEGRNEEAVKLFRAFMDDVKVLWPEVEQDPSTGILYTKEMALGLNAKRIGDIMAKAGDQARAQAAYKEAHDYYTNALATARADSKEQALIKSRLAEIPAQ